jgi:predicted transcriptional regulator of viral defense system
MAASQRGLFSVAQARQIGVSNAQLMRWQGGGQLKRVRRGVYAMSGVPSSPWEQIVGAALAVGRDAVVSHSSAAAVHRFHYGSIGTLELTLPRGAYSRPPGVVVHRTSDLTPLDTVRRHGLAITSASRTLVDLAGR